MKDKDAIYCNSSNGPCFASNSWFIINVSDSIFKTNGNSCKASQSYYKGITSDYELNNGEMYFSIEEIEVFQIVSY